MNDGLVTVKRSRMAAGIRMACCALALGLGGAAGVWAAPDGTIAPETANAGIYDLLREGQKNRLRIGGDETAAADFFARLNAALGTGIADRGLRAEATDFTDRTDYCSDGRRTHRKGAKVAKNTLGCAEFGKLDGPRTCPPKRLREGGCTHC